MFLAFKIRKVKIHGLNESREVSAILYITSIMLVIMIVVSYAFGDYIDVEAAVFGFGLSTLITVVLGLTFVPKVKILIGEWCYYVTEGIVLSIQMWGLHKDPEGKNVLKRNVMSRNGLFMDTGSTGDSQVAALNARIKKLELYITQREDSHRSRLLKDTDSGEEENTDYVCWGKSTQFLHAQTSQT